MHSISLKKRSPLIHRFPTHEIDYPYRWSNSWILRLPFSTHGMVIGWWHQTNRTEEQAILDSMMGRDMSYKELVDEKKVTIRRKMIKEGFDAEKQKLIAEALDIL